MAIITKVTTVEYGQNSELSQLSEGDGSRCNARKLPIVKDLNCMVNEMKRILVHSQNIDEAAFSVKYGRLLEITKIEVLNPAIKALINFWDPDYRCFSFGNVDLCPTVEEYGMLMEFPKHLHKVYFPLRSDKVIPELSKLLKIPYLSRFLEKNASGLKWKFLEIELERKKSQYGSMLERDRLIALGIYGPVLFPSLTGVISLEAAAAFVEYENTHVNPITAILAETFLTLNHFRKTGKGAMRCCTKLLYIWMESERLRDPSSSEGYEKWRNLTPTAAPRMPCSEDGPSRIIEGSFKRKKVSNEEDLMGQLERLQIELGKSKDKFLHVQAELMDRIEKYDELNKKCVMVKSRLAELQEFERKGKEEEVVKADLATKKNEIRMLKAKLDREREKVRQLTEKLEASKKHKEQIDTNNNTLNQNNMLLMEKMAKVDEQMDEAAIHARIIRTNARRVGRDIFCYRQSLAETDAFLEKIEN
eukprot:XP_024449508.1 uncharacterized protein LOC112326280 [Populus trichocarpa]